VAGPADRAGTRPISEYCVRNVQSFFMSGAAPKACNFLHQVFKLQDERAISAYRYLFKCGLDDQDPQDQDDVDTLHAEGHGNGIPDVEVLSPDEQEGDGDQKDEMKDEEEEEEEKEKEDEEEEGGGRRRSSLIITRTT